VLFILLVDENPSDRLLVIRELEREFSELQVLEILDAQTLERAIARGGFDLVITDYRLNWGNGLDVLKACKAQYPQCPVIMYTGSGNEEIAVEAMKAGLDDYITKSPRHYFRLAVAIRGILDRYAAQRQLTHVENRLQSLLDRLNVGVFRSTSDGILLESNQAFQRLVEYSNLTDSQPINLRSLFWETVDPAEQTIQPQEIRLPQAHSQSHKWVLLTQYVNAEDSGTVIDGIVEDITDLKQAELALRQLNETLELRVAERTAQLEDINEQLEGFAYSVSHDLRAPLRAIESFSQILKADYFNHLDRVGQDYITRIESSAALMNHLIDSLLEYSRINLLTLDLEPLDLNIVVAQALSQLELEMNQQQAEVTIAAPLPMVYGQFSALVRAVLNVISNAIKFVGVGVHPRITIWAEVVSAEERNRLGRDLYRDRRLSSLPTPSPSQIPSQILPQPGIPSAAIPQKTESGERWVRLWVEDNGIGIDEEYHQRIFGVFERLHGIEVYPGIGIGLAIARRAVERMNGQIGLESTPGQGSRFWICLRNYEG
jgi:signal transduction histidine kinase